MRWFVCVALSAALGLNVLAVVPAKADGFSIGAVSSYSSPSHRWYKHYHDTRSGGGTSCFAAASSLWQQGYRAIEATDCNGGSYSFRARSNLVRYQIDVNAATGGVTFVRPY